MECFDVDAQLPHDRNIGNFSLCTKIGGEPRHCRIGSRGVGRAIRLIDPFIDSVIVEWCRGFVEDLLDFLQMIRVREGFQEVSERLYFDL